MNLLRKIVGKKSDFRIRYSKSSDEWHVYRENQLLYVGTKQLCERFVKHSMEPVSH